MNGIIKLIIVSQAIVILGYVIHCHDVEARELRMEKVAKELSLELSKVQHELHISKMNANPFVMGK